MLFNSIHYFIFAPVVIFLYFWLPRRFQAIWLFLVSLYFYAIFKLPFIVLLIFSFTWTKFCGDWIYKSETKRKKIIFLNLAVFGNLGLLYFFKYIDFSFTIWNTVFDLNACDPFYASSLGVILPMGISFFTLQAVSYAVDIYRGLIKPAKSVFHFGLFLSFFPQLVAGPIIRASDMLHQFLEKQDFKKENLYPGLRQAFWGVFKKTFIADPLSYAIDPVFASPGSYDSYAIWLVACLFSVQIYCDFSGYSDIAIGTGRILGFDIPKNFIRPFLSGTISELWRRWHISFSSWIRDYVYITLGGNKRGVFLSYVNLFVTMFVSGIWHGADWNYIIWGFCHAGFMVFERFIFKFKAIENGWNRVPYYLRPLYPFLIFSFSMLYFRAKPLEGFSNSAAVGNFMVQHGFSGFNGLFPEIPIALYVLIGVLFFVEILQNKKEEIFDSIMNRPIVLYSTCAILYLVSIIIYSVTKSQPFVYFQF